MCAHLLKEAKAFDNPMVQVDELSLAQPVNIGPFHSATVGCIKPRMPVTLRVLVASAHRR
jgi:hypothetical protein